MATKAPQLMQQYVTRGDRSLRDWHLLLRRATFGAALVLMSASVVSLHWACNLIGLNGYWEPVAWAVPLAMEVGMAATASTATTIRKDPRPDSPDSPGGYYLSLWIIFSFVMLLAQGANIGHAITTVAADADQLPQVIPQQAVFVFASAFAALFPLGGTLFVHVSGFLRAHGTGARWIEGDSEIVHVQLAPGAPAPARTNPPRAPQSAPSARAATEPTRAPDARTEHPAARADASRTRAPKDATQVRARELFDAAIAADPLVKPNAKDIHDEIGSTANVATTRRWIQQWFAEHEEQMGMARPEPTPPTPLTVVAEEAEEAETGT